jgi:sugar diacid utilization regulator
LYYPGNAFSTPKLCVNIARSGKTLYRLMISEGDVPLDDTFGFLLEYLAKIISHALATSTSAVYDATHTLQQIFLTLLTDPRADYVEISQQLTMEGWLSSHTYQCVLIKIGILDQKNRTLRSICSYVENTIPASCAVEHQGNAVVYINLDLCSYSWDEISQKLARFIRDSLLNAGYSRKMLGHFNFHRQYVQASIALQMGKRMEPSRWIHQFNQIALPYLLEQTTRKLPAYMVCHERLLQLKYMDDDGHTQLYETTRCYLEHHQNITRTSEALFIHRSTLLYRLEKIKEILKTDFSDPDEWFYLLLSFRLMDLEDQSSKKQDV